MNLQNINVDVDNIVNGITITITYKYFRPHIIFVHSNDISQTESGTFNDNLPQDLIQFLFNNLSLRQGSSIIPPMSFPIIENSFIIVRDVYIVVDQYIKDERPEDFYKKSEELSIFFS